MMSQHELSRLRIMVEFEDGRLTVAAAAALMGIEQRRVFRLRLRQAFATAGPSGLASKKHTARVTIAMVRTSGGRVLTLVRDFGPTLAVQKLAPRHTAICRWRGA